ncbi:MAG: hypothetical protein ACYSU7_17930, partial [Planctomycetota bacterium]
MHDQGQRPPWHLAGLGRVELDGEDPRRLGVDPTACPERQRAAQHDQAPAEIVHVGVQRAVLFVGDGEARDVGEHDRVVGGQEDRPPGQGRRPRHLHRQFATGQRVHQVPRLGGAVVNDEDLALGPDKGHRHRPVVAADAVQGGVVRFEGGLELHGTGRVETQRDRHHGETRVEGHGQGIARLVAVEVELLVVHRERDSARGVALAAEHELHVGGLAEPGPGRRGDPLEDHLVGVLVLQHEHVDGHVVGGGQLRGGQEIADGLVAVGGDHDPVGRVLGHEGQG